MNSWIVLLRGINVGGNNIIPMKQLAELLKGLGCQSVQTYIQSGNVLLKHSESNNPVLTNLIAQHIHQTFGFTPHILLLSLTQFEQAVANNPYPDAQSEPKTLHLFFLEKPALSANLEALTAVKKENESYRLLDQIFYLHAPDGIGRSKLVASVEKHLGVPCTARNWNTVSKILSLAANN